eukprot:30644-Eustigmatos_ZCMA.PRE.1
MQSEVKDTDGVMGPLAEICSCIAHQVALSSTVAVIQFGRRDSRLVIIWYSTAHASSALGASRSAHCVGALLLLCRLGDRLSLLLFALPTGPFSAIS